MIKGTPRKARSLNALLCFGDDKLLFEKEIITGLTAGGILGDTYNFYKEEVDIYEHEYLMEGDAESGPTIQTISFPKNELIEYAIHIEAQNALNFLQNNYNKSDNYSAHQWIFARILKCYLSAFDVSIADYPYRDLFIEYFTEIVKKSLFLYKGIFGKQFNLKEVRSKLITDLRTNETGYRLQPILYGLKIKPFIDGLIAGDFVDSKDEDALKLFFHGDLPNKKIVWKRELRYFVYFIKKLTGEKDKSTLYLMSCPTQRWKHLDEFFSHPDLTGKFYENFYVLGKKRKKEIDLIFDTLK